LVQDLPWADRQLFGCLRNYCLTRKKSPGMWHWYRLLNSYWLFGGACCFHLLGSSLVVDISQATVIFINAAVKCHISHTIFKPRCPLLSHPDKLLLRHFRNWIFTCIWLKNNWKDLYEIWYSWILCAVVELFQFCLKSDT